jgi:hypothetical protein
LFRKITSLASAPHPLICKEQLPLINLRYADSAGVGDYLKATYLSIKPPQAIFI